VKTADAVSAVADPAPVAVVEAEAVDSALAAVAAVASAAKDFVPAAADVVSVPAGSAPHGAAEISAAVVLKPVAIPASVQADSAADVVFVAAADDAAAPLASAEPVSAAVDSAAVDSALCSRRSNCRDPVRVANLARAFAAQAADFSAADVVPARPV
jgi:hypothetical protein